MSQGGTKRWQDLFVGWEMNAAGLLRVRGGAGLASNEGGAQKAREAGGLWHRALIGLPAQLHQLPAQLSPALPAAASLPASGTEAGSPPAAGTVAGSLLAAAAALAHGDGTLNGGVRCCKGCAASLGPPAPPAVLGSCALRCAAPAGPAAASLWGAQSMLRLPGCSGGRGLPGAEDLASAPLWLRVGRAQLWLRAGPITALGMGSSTVEAGEIFSALPMRIAASLGAGEAAADTIPLVIGGRADTSWLYRRTGVVPPGGAGAGARVSSCTSSAAVGRTLGSGSRQRRMMSLTSSGQSSGTLHQARGASGVGAGCSASISSRPPSTVSRAGRFASSMRGVGVTVRQRGSHRAGQSEQLLHSHQVGTLACTQQPCMHTAAVHAQAAVTLHSLRSRPHMGSRSWPRTGSRPVQISLQQQSQESGQMWERTEHEGKGGDRRAALW